MGCAATPPSRIAGYSKTKQNQKRTCYTHIPFEEDCINPPALLQGVPGAKEESFDLITRRCTNLVAREERREALLHGIYLAPQLR